MCKWVIHFHVQYLVRPFTQSGGGGLTIYWKDSSLFCFESFWQQANRKWLKCIVIPTWNPFFVLQEKVGSILSLLPFERIWGFDRFSSTMIWIFLLWASLSFSSSFINSGLFLWQKQNHQEKFRLKASIHLTAQIFFDNDQTLPEKF